MARSAGSAVAAGKWQTPYYDYVIGARSLKIRVDVTLSIPSFAPPAPGLADVVIEFKSRGFKTVLDFGAGKLRNTKYLLQQGFQVGAVEFGQAFESDKAKERLDEVETLGRGAGGKRFFYLEYPHDFLSFTDMVDAAVLINVVNVVPEPSDRTLILEECGKRIKKGGLLYIMTQYGEPSYRANVTDRRALNDGWCYRLNQSRQTFNKEFSIAQLRALVPRAYFREHARVKANHHRALLYERK